MCYRMILSVSLKKKEFYNTMLMCAMLDESPYAVLTCKIVRKEMGLQSSVSRQSPTTQLLLCPFLECLHHHASNLIRHGCAHGGIERIDEFVLDAKAHLGRCRRLLRNGMQRPSCYQTLEYGCGARGAPCHSITADCFDKDAGLAMQTTRKGLIEATPPNVQIGERGPPPTSSIRLRPLCDTRDGAVGDELRVRVDVGDELVQRFACVR